MALLDHQRDQGRRRIADSGLCIGVTLAGLTALAMALNWLMALI